MPCAHNQIGVDAKTIRSDQKPVTFRLEIRMKCEACGEPFRFGKGYASTTDGTQYTCNVEPGARKKPLPVKAVA